MRFEEINTFPNFSCTVFNAIEQFIQPGCLSSPFNTFGFNGLFMANSFLHINYYLCVS